MEKAESNPLKVFVYGTLKPGEINYDHYCQGRVLHAQAAIMIGQLYDLPFGYPAMTVGNSLVYGFLLSFADPAILTHLDQLEEYDPNRPTEQNEYVRVAAEVFDLNHRSLGQAWVYQMDKTLVNKLGGILLPQGRWGSPTGSQAEYRL
ncbi:gamma-glutamylcyclotransferase [Leptolyngbya sp. NK1-12]|uniref:Gamma-glutamylcyclotransferase n=1 Tax=Leptolyngbya sp. NK1-12 TaxID=2547451 RepID=A0AA96WTX0_9CYAN|nr:gamma-glutamylcyclotransferase [Leptolyngbya sp. NK1-12]